jgi:hypothetical protein
LSFARAILRRIQEIDKQAQLYPGKQTGLNPKAFATGIALHTVVAEGVDVGLIGVYPALSLWCDKVICRAG